VEDEERFDIELTRSEDSARAVLTISGEIDMATAPEIDDAVALIAGRAETTDVVIDLTDVTFIDSSGIAALLRCRKLMDEAQIGFNVTGTRGMPLTVLEITGVLSYLSTPIQTGAVDTD